MLLLLLARFLRPRPAPEPAPEPWTFARVFGLLGHWDGPPGWTAERFALPEEGRIVICRTRPRDGKEVWGYLDVTPRALADPKSDWPLAVATMVREVGAACREVDAPHPLVAVRAPADVRSN